VDTQLREKGWLTEEHSYWKATINLEREETWSWKDEQ
jgi:hypothetical protein